MHLFLELLDVLPAPFQWRTGELLPTRGARCRGAVPHLRAPDQAL